jgi:hypothetical protein
MTKPHTHWWSGGRGSCYLKEREVNRRGFDFYEGGVEGKGEGEGREREHILVIAKSPYSSRAIVVIRKMT